MCDLCNIIYKNQEDYQDKFESPYDETTALVREPEYQNKVYLYVPCEDYYYSDTRVQCNYCPKCGRNLLSR